MLEQNVVAKKEQVGCQHTAVLPVCTHYFPPTRTSQEICDLCKELEESNQARQAAERNLAIQNECHKAEIMQLQDELEQSSIDLNQKDERISQLIRDKEDMRDELRNAREVILQEKDQQMYVTSSRVLPSNARPAFICQRLLFQEIQYLKA